MYSLDLFKSNLKCFETTETLTKWLPSTGGGTVMWTGAGRWIGTAVTGLCRGLWTGSGARKGAGCGGWLWSPISTVA